MITISTGLQRGVSGSGGGISSYMDRGVFEFYTGAQPNSADFPVTGTLLGRVTNNGDAFVQDSAANGVRIQQSIDGSLIDDGSWMFTPIANGTVGWWRWRWYLEDNGGASSFLPRIDGGYGDSLTLASQQVRIGNPFNVQFYMIIVGS